MSVITAILYVLKQSFDQANLSFFTYFLLFLISKLQLDIYKLSLFIWIFIHQLFFFNALVIIFASFIIDLFVCIDQIIVRWSWNLFLGTIANCLWSVSKQYIWIFLPQRFLEGFKKGGCWVFRLVLFNWFLFLV